MTRQSARHVGADVPRYRRGWIMRTNLVVGALLFGGCLQSNPAYLDSSDGGGDGGGSGDGSSTGTSETGTSSAASSGPGESGDSDGPELPPPLDGDVVTYGGALRFDAVERLSDGSFIVGGRAADLAWVPADVEVVELSGVALDSRSESVAFLLHLSANLDRVEHVVRFPGETVRDVHRIRTTSLPGEPTGSLIISGSRDNATVEDGYYIAQLDGNFVDAVPRALVWASDVRAAPRSPDNESQYKLLQPWDVDGQGRVTYGLGTEDDWDWAAIGRYNADGTDAIVPGWPLHWIGTGEHRGHYDDYDGSPPISRSGIALKAGRMGSLRSLSQDDYDVVSGSGNGGSKRGAWPDDYFFSGPCTSEDECAGGPGYTGYARADRPTQRLGAIAVDRRDGSMVFGYSTRSNRGSEPAVVAMDPEGNIRWWSRLHEEGTEGTTPEQFVDGLAIDYATDSVVVLGRSAGNDVVNFWSGSAIAARPGASAFQNEFTGSNGDVHISWLGKLRLADGELQASTYVAEYVDGDTNWGDPFGEGLLEGWPDPNTGWPDVNTTRCGGLRVTLSGEVSLMCSGRRTMTTSNAWQQMVKPNEGVSKWNDFVRVYTSDLSDVRYSSLLVGSWNPQGAADEPKEVELQSIAPIAGGIIGVGRHVLDDEGSTPLGVALDVESVPSWGVTTPEQGTAVLFHFALE